MLNVKMTGKLGMLLDIDEGIRHKHAQSKKGGNGKVQKFLLN